MGITSQDNNRRTQPHRRVEKILDAMRISYESEYDAFTPYALDIYLPEWHLAVEIDGPTHSKAKDAKRDNNLLVNYGVLVLHIPTGEPVDAIKYKVRQFIDAHARTAKERRSAWLEG